MLFRPENVVKKVDSLGRVTLPKGLRDRFNINTNDELEILTLDLESGESYVCLRKPVNNNGLRYAEAKKVLEELGLDIPEELEEKISEKNI